jgi:hypothetical protein
MFARYAGTNMSPVPSGYLEAASQEGAMYANIGNSVANIMMKKQEMGLKEKEIEATNATAQAKAGENTVKGQKDNNDFIIAGRKQDTADFVARAAVLKDSQAGLIGELGGIDTALNRHNTNTEVLTPEVLSRYKARKAQIMLDMETGNKQLQDFMLKIANKGNESSGSISAPPGTGGQSPKGGTNIREAGPNEKPKSLWESVKARVGFNQPSEPTSGGTEGYSEDSTDTSDETTSELQFPQTVTPEPTPPSATKEPETPTRTVFRSHLNIPVNTPPSLDVTDKNGTKSRAIGTFVSQTTSDGTPMNPMLNLNGVAFQFDSNGKLTLTKEFDKYSDEDKRQYLSQARILHVMSWAINNQPELLRRIEPSPEEKEAAEEFYINDGNRADYNSIVRAYAYASRDRRPEVEMTWAQGELDTAFVDQFQVSTNDFIELGVDMYTASSSSTWLEEQTNAARGRASAASSKIGELIKLRPESNNVAKNPYTDKIYKAQEKVNTAVRNAEGVVGPFAESAKSNINAAQAELAALQASANAWEAENGVSAIKARSELLEINIRGGLDAELARLKDFESIRTSQDASLIKMGEVFSTWVGINKGDKERYFGYVAQGVKNFRGYPTTINGRPSNLSAAEFRNWAMRDPINSSKVTGVSGMYAGQFPTIDTLTKPNVQDSVARSTSEMGKLVRPLQELHGLFSELNKMGGMERVKESWFNAKFAASEGLRASLVANIRTAFIGGGNPSNFEQEILRATVPDTGTLFTYTEFNLNRMRTLAIAVMLSHYRTMTANGMEMTEDSLAAYNREFSGIIGRKMTMDDFVYFKSMTDRGNQEWQGVPSNAKENYGKTVGRNVFEELTNGAVQRFGDLEKK